MLRLLFERRLDEYFAAFRAGGRPWVFVHVPKTAGSSLRGELARAMLPEANVFVDYSDPGKSHMQRLDDAVAAFLIRDRASPHRFVSGHLFPRHVAAIEKAMGGVRLISMLRQPVRRVIPDYRYQCSPMHPGNEAFRSRFPTFRDYLRQEEESNKAARYLLPHALLQAGDAEGCVEHVLDTYHFMGLREMYPLSFRMLFALLGERRAPTLRVRVNEAAAGEAAPEADAGLVREVEARNALDMALHKAFLARWQAIRDPAIAYLGQLGAAPAGRDARV